MEKLTIQEEEAMLYIWELGSCFVKDIVAKYPKPAPPYTTVASIVKNLERKQYIRAARVGNTYQYTPLILSGVTLTRKAYWYNLRLYAKANTNVPL